MSKKANLKVKFGEPEHVIDRDRAVVLVANLMKFKPESENKQMITKELVGDKKLFDGDKIHEQFGIQAEGPGDAADKIADSVIRKLEGNENQFSRFTAESIAIITRPMVETLGKADINAQAADDVDTAINMLPASNGKTFTAVQMLRTEKQLLSEDDFHEACQYATQDARYPKTWVKPEFGSKLSLEDKPLPVVVPRGISDMNEFVEVANTPFTSLSDAQQEAVVNIYTNADQVDTLNTMIEKSNDDGLDNPDVVESQAAVDNPLTSGLSLSGLDELSDTQDEEEELK